MSMRLVAVSAVASFFGCSLAARHSNADVQACVDAHREGQVQRDRSDFVAAYDSFSSCMGEECPGPIRAECADFRQKLDAAMPTVILVARDASGNDVPETVVEVDGRPLSTGLTGRAVPLNPGPRRFTFTGPSGERAEVTVVVSEGVKGREVVGRFASAEAPARDEGAKPVRNADADGAAPAAPDRTLAYVLAGGGAAALGAFAYFGLSGRSRFDELKSSCAPRCSEAAADGVTSRYVLADVSLLVAAGLLGGATYFYLVPPGREEPAVVGFAAPF